MRTKEIPASRPIVESEKSMMVKPFRDVPLKRLAKLFGGDIGAPWINNGTIRWNNDDCEITTRPAREILRGRIEPEKRYFTKPYVVDNDGQNLVYLEQAGYAEVEKKVIIAFPRVEKRYLRIFQSIEDRTEYQWIEISKDEGFNLRSKSVTRDQEDLIPEAVVRASILAELIKEYDVAEKERQEDARKDEEAMKRAREYAASRKG